MLLKLRERMASEKGFTLIELLVVMLIIGILAAIAIPTFFNQKQKANDSSAKAMAHTAQTAMETCGTDNNGSYANCNLAALTGIEASIGAGGNTVSLPTAATATDYQVRATNATTGHWFQINRTGGTFTFTCNPGGQGGCPTGGAWG
ncbi:MAG: type IV pilin protein [Actinomycetes bacterium]